MEMEDLLYKNRDWLDQKYTVEKLSTVKIGEICGVKNYTIGRWMYKFSIAARRPAEALGFDENDIVGQKYNKLTVLKYSHFKPGQNGQRRHYYLCRCECGNEKIIPRSSLVYRNTHSCGCQIGRNYLNNPQDIIGKQFGRLHVLKYLHKEMHSNGVRINKYEYFYLCKCDCGKTVVKKRRSIKAGYSSCGCLWLEKRLRFLRLPEGEAAFNKLYAQYQRAAKSRDLIFELTTEQFKSLTKQNCYYCGNPPNFVYSYKNGNGDYIYNGVDRKDNNVGYTPSNSVPCCGICNKAKWDRSEEDFKSWINRVYNHINNHPTI